MMRRVMVTGVALGFLTLTGCSSVVTGTPMADPAQTGVTTTTTTTTRSTPTWSPTTEPPSPSSSGGASTPPPNGMSTTCTEFDSMDDATKQGMVELLADNGYPGMARNPALWTTFIGIKCKYAPAGSSVVAALEAEIPG